MEGCRVTVLTIVKGITIMAMDYDTVMYDFCQSAFLAKPMKQLGFATLWVFNSSVVRVLESHLYRNESSCLLSEGLRQRDLGG